MFQPISLCISIKFFIKKTINSYNYFTSLLSIIGISIGVMSIIFILSIINGFEKKFIYNTFRFIPHIILSSNEKKNYFYKNIHILKKNSLKYIKKIYPIITEDVLLQSKYNISIGKIIGIKNSDKNFFNSYIKNKKKNKLKKFHIIIGKGIANKLKIKKNDLINIIVPFIKNKIFFKSFLIKKICKVSDIFYTNNEVDDNHILMNQKDISKLMKYPKNVITEWYIWLYNPIFINKIIINYFYKNFKCTNWKETKKYFFRSIKIEKNMMIILLSLIFIISIFNIITSLILQISEKKIEISILKTQGFKNYQIINIFFLQGLIIGIIGSIFGVFLGILFSKNINNLLKIFDISFNEIFIPIEINYYQIIKIIFVTIFIVIISSFFPSLISYNINPSETLKNE
ncbi:FtsX-like permease family protein [Sodalis-like secondary symbiont of Drepanosiphum platanoidis]|uniref:FtsX-like permease family protein n=1 Tax=Sodalis-like secondary symbiont of Drepanosiphum platanoidis TaxID=2994493 RepID=UPI003464813E